MIVGLPFELLTMLLTHTRHCPRMSQGCENFVSENFAQSEWQRWLSPYTVKLQLH